MSRNLFMSNNSRLNVSSFAGPANTLERTRVRLQFEVISTIDDEDPNVTSIGFDDAVALRSALDRWIAEQQKSEK